MKIYFKMAVLTGFTLGCAVMPAIAQETGFTPMERELQYIMKTWPGDYDNQEQASFDARARQEPQADQPRFHAVVHPLKLPALGKHVLYIEDRENDDLEKLSHQRLYVLSADESENAVRVKSYKLKSGDRFQAAGRDLTKLSKIKTDHAVYQEGCDMLIRRDGETHKGETRTGKCKEGDTYLKRHVSLSKTGYSFKEKHTDEKGVLINAIADYRARNMKRARWFTCMIDVPKEIPGRSNHTQHYMKIHDQGGSFPFTHPDGRDMTLLMRNTWSYGMQRETFFIGVLEGDVSGKTLVYSWGMPGQDRIGVNPGYVRIQCDLDTPENVKLQKGLRSES